MHNQAGIETSRSICQRQERLISDQVVGKFHDFLASSNRTPHPRLDGPISDHFIIKVWIQFPGKASEVEVKAMVARCLAHKQSAVRNIWLSFTTSLRSRTRTDIALRRTIRRMGRDTIRVISKIPLSFSVDNPESLENVENRWVPEISPIHPRAANLRRPNQPAQPKVNSAKRKRYWSWRSHICTNRLAAWDSDASST
ncbi:9444_t:CDS:2 [Acaulospora colombiana]|uniref:9444_t:CDS:1 n=1 Tax=Acaulospora colombiana TaxID=27376 RepID=A0ACA9NG79_9GLOM|nr:9444_t:CDS:2 [Acaulospora colombiana]